MQGWLERPQQWPKKHEKKSSQRFRMPSCILKLGTACHTDSPWSDQDGMLTSLQTPIENSDLGFVLSASICVHRRPIAFFRGPSRMAAQNASSWFRRLKSWSRLPNRGGRRLNFLAGVFEHLAHAHHLLLRQFPLLFFDALANAGQRLHAVAG